MHKGTCMVAPMNCFSSISLGLSSLKKIIEIDPTMLNHASLQSDTMSYSMKIENEDVV